MGMSVARRAQSAPLPKPDDFLSEPFTCRGLGTAWACQVNVGQRRGVPIAEAMPSGTAVLQTSVASSFIAAPPVPRPLQDSSRKTQRVQPDRHPSLFRRGDRPTRDTVAIRRNGERKNNEMPDYFVFVAWACRLLLHWSLYQRQR